MVLDLNAARDVPVTERTLHHALRTQATNQADKPALLDGDRSLTYGQLYSQTRRFATGFAALGVEPGTAVLLMLDNHLDFVLTWFGVNACGGIEVPINTAYLDAMLTHILHDSGAEILVIEDRYLDRLAQVWDRPHKIKHVVVRGDGTRPTEGPWGSPTSFGDLPGERERDPVAVNAWDPMGYLYTSGTTGPSKGVIISHAQAFTYSLTHWVSPDDRIMVNLPLFHIGGQWAGVYTALVAGASAAIIPRFHASTFWTDAARSGCTQTLLIGAMATFLLKQEPRETDRGHTMRRLGMAPVIPEVREFERRFGVVTGSAYGLTESATPIVTPYGQTEPGLAGWLRPNFDARVVDDNDLEVAPGTVGELLLRPHEPWTTMMGYLGRPRETSDTWRNQWFHTGDYMYVNDRGQYSFVDRKKDAIRVRGENVSSFEVETAINQHPDVLESACVAAPSESTEDEIRVFVVARNGCDLSPEGLLEFLVARLPYFMIPRFVEFVPALPKTPTTRVQKDELRQRPLTEAWDRDRAGYRVTREGRG